MITKYLWIVVGGGIKEILSVYHMCRCGILVYKPNNRKTCCPAYTIRCDAMNFRISKSQKKVLRDINNFLATGKRHQNEAKSLAVADCKGDRSGDLVEPPKSRQNPMPQPYGDTGSTGSQGPSTVTCRSGTARRKRWQRLQERMAKRAKESNTPYEDILKACFIHLLFFYHSVFCFRTTSFDVKDASIRISLGSSRNISTLLCQRVKLLTFWM